MPAQEVLVVYLSMIWLLLYMVYTLWKELF